LHKNIGKRDIIEAVDGKRVDDTTEISINVRKKTPRGQVNDVY